MSKNNKFNRGSAWRRWDLHVHTPGTALNNNYNGNDVAVWEKFIKKIEEQENVTALGIADYLSIEGYKKVLEYKKSGRLSNIDLIIPNIEFRITPETEKSKGINIHILVSPELEDHVQIIEESLSRLTIKINDQPLGCCRSSFIAIGKKRDKNSSDEAAYREGINQYKVDFSSFQEWFKQESVLQQNSLIAVSNSTNDGVSGLQKDNGFAETRDQIYRFTDIIFSARPKDREYFLGKGVDNLDVICEKYKAIKPCLHGSDAHSFEKLFEPDEKRYCWIKADLTFEGLKQTVIEPESRVFIGEKVTSDSFPSHIIDKIEINNASWLKNNAIPLNPGLITIIGARGSGKTALADFIAVGGYSMSQQKNDRSFVKRAEEKLQNESVKLFWKSKEETSNNLKSIGIEDILDAPKVQYLSQQFVDQLCSADGLTNELMKEIERVIFDYHKQIDRKGAESFDELMELELSSVTESRKFYEDQIEDYINSLNILCSKKDSVATLKQSLQSKKKIIEEDKKNRQSLVGNDQENLTKEYETISIFLDQLRVNLENETRKKSSLETLKTVAVNIKNNVIPNSLRKLKQDHPGVSLTEEQWGKFELSFKGDVEEILSLEILKSEKIIISITGEKIPEIKDDKLKDSLILPDADLSKQTYNLLKAEQGRIERLIGIGKENSVKLRKISEKITKDEVAYTKLENEIKEAESSGEKIAELVRLRKESYKSVFATLLEHEKILENLYQPLMNGIKDDGDTLEKLTFHVQRFVDVDEWVKSGEDLLDLRKGTTFRKKGYLHEVVKKYLLPVWQKGSAEDVANAMEKFLEEYTSSLRECSPVEKQDANLFRDWANKISAWLYSTSHISIKYGVQYDGVSIQQLSPGTRGIVLLLLYLVIDKDDYRPLIIDQPEENLDPKSIYDELVTRFRSAKQKRQIIIVTHNANLVVNTDAEQVIVASCISHQQNQLPEIDYVSGSLENPEIRKKVCEILEGGERAFKERAKRLRVSM